MRKAITTKVVPATLSKPQRVKATIDDDSSSLTWNMSLTDEQNHIAAASSLAYGLNLFGDWHGGETTDGYAFVRIDPSGLPAFSIPFPED